MQPPESSAAQRYRKKPVEVEAIQWTGENVIEAHALAGDDVKPLIDGNCTVYTLHGPVLAQPGTWIVRRPGGDTWPVTNGVFEETYEPV